MIPPTSVLPLRGPNQNTQNLTQPDPAVSLMMQQMQIQMQQLQEYQNSVMQWQKQMQESHVTEINRLKAMQTNITEETRRQNQTLYDNNTTPSNGSVSNNQSLINTQSSTKGRDNFKLQSNTKVFSGGNNPKVDTWLFDVENQFKTNQIPDHMKLHVVANFLGGAPHRMLRESIREGQTWREFEEMLRKRYEPVDYGEELIDN